MIHQSSSKNIVNKTKKEIDVGMKQGEIKPSETSNSDLSKTLSTVNNAFVKKQNIAPSVKEVKTNVKKFIKSNIESRNKRNRKR